MPFLVKIVTQWTSYHLKSFPGWLATWNLRSAGLQDYWRIVSLLKPYSAMVLAVANSHPTFSVLPAKRPPQF